MKIEYYEDMLEQEAINKYLNMIANDYGGELAKIFEEKYINKDKEIERLNNVINEIEKEIDWLLERQYESERFAKEQGFNTYLPAKENLLCVKNKLQELKRGDKE